MEKELATLKAEKKQTPIPSIINDPYYLNSPYFSLYGISFTGSILLNDCQKILLMRWRPGKWISIYRATTHGQASSTFHNCCDNKGPTYVVARCASGYTFGAYAASSWNHGINTYHTAPTSFLFTLNNSYGDPPTQFPLKNEGNGSALFSKNSYGPTFGAGHDLYIHTTPLSSNSYCELGHTYVNSIGRGNNTFTGSRTFRLQDYEVYMSI